MKFLLTLIFTSLSLTSCLSAEFDPSKVIKKGCTKIYQPKPVYFPKNCSEFIKRTTMQETVYYTATCDLYRDDDTKAGDNKSDISIFNKNEDKENEIKETYCNYKVKSSF